MEISLPDLITPIEFLFSVKQNESTAMQLHFKGFILEIDENKGKLLSQQEKTSE